MPRRLKPVLGFIGEHLLVERPLTEETLDHLARHLGVSTKPIHWDSIRLRLEQAAVEYRRTVAARTEMQLVSNGPEPVPLPIFPAIPVPSRPSRRAPSRGERTAALEALARDTSKLRRRLAGIESQDLELRPKSWWVDAFARGLENLQERVNDLLNAKIADRPKGLSRKTTLEELKRRAANVHALFVGLDLASQLEVIARVPDNPVDSLHTLGGLHRLLEFVDSAAHAALRDGRKHRGPLPDTSVLVPIGFLIELWEDVTGKKATHTPRGKVSGERLREGRPHSRFGLFVVEFFKAVDPTVSETQISSAITTAMRNLRDAKKREKPSNR